MQNGGRYWTEACCSRSVNNEDSSRSIASESESIPDRHNTNHVRRTVKAAVSQTDETISAGRASEIELMPAPVDVW